MKRMGCMLLLCLLSAGAGYAERLDEATAVSLRSGRKALWLRADTKTAASSGARISFWVGRKGEVEAVELSCGDRALFDEIVDAVLDWKFNRENFITDLSFVRRGRRVWLVLELPPVRRPKNDICAGDQAAGRRRARPLDYSV